MLDFATKGLPNGFRVTGFSVTGYLRRFGPHCHTAGSKKLRRLSNRALSTVGCRRVSRLRRWPGRGNTRRQRWLFWSHRRATVFRLCSLRRFLSSAAIDGANFGFPITYGLMTVQIPRTKNISERSRRLRFNTGAATGQPCIKCPLAGESY